MHNRLRKFVLGKLDDGVTDEAVISKDFIAEALASGEAEEWLFQPVRSEVGSLVSAIERTRRGMARSAAMAPSAGGEDSGQVHSMDGSQKAHGLAAQVQDGGGVQAAHDGQGVDGPAPDLSRQAHNSARFFSPLRNLRIPVVEGTVADFQAAIAYYQRHIAGLESTVAEYQGYIEEISAVGGGEELTLGQARELAAKQESPAA